MPELLISVRNVPEATSALDGGCSIVDIKEPANGPLGMACVDVIVSIAKHLGSSRLRRLSVALGELDEWPAERPIPALLNSCDYLKVGPGTLEDPAEWEEALRRLRQRFDQAGISRPRWIAALYADRPLLSKAFPQIVSLRNIGYDGLMVDTAEKAGRSLLDSLPVNQLRDLVELCRESAIRIGLAGSLSQGAMESLLKAGVRPDLFGVRSAACGNHDRSGTVQKALVEQLRNVLRPHA
ncbi:(5-formylfuran-3-yl)methyl phosphate synthase [Rubinisphaera margarita]|uniref:(5-formylfuran-3-yl)methyl phosphate synthase n=1 Tax=Rubinisphaera margarita TaxID=2909586 RepID=UPI001EE82A0C|nr:(5-formylfuran-3-yl)methyl phosphate synthase [Rubinisphaera margarita]MCG6157027.1 (5-formylfuran-3-yl)methyl phosphate synthase [Rubinisphaera margarita]